MLSLVRDYGNDQLLQLKSAIELVGGIGWREIGKIEHAGGKSGAGICRRKISGERSPTCHIGARLQDIILSGQTEQLQLELATQERICAVDEERRKRRIQLRLRNDGFNRGRAAPGELR